MNKKIFFLVIFIPFINLYANNLFLPLPQTVKYDTNKVTLGKKLFFDTALSKDYNISCATCHHNYGVDNLSFSKGHKGAIGTINTPTIFNSEFNLALFWNGRSSTFKEQLLDGPITNEHEMAGNPALIIKRLNESKEYKVFFRKAYNSTPNYEYMLDAISSFEKTLITPNAKFDKYLRGELLLSPLEQKGLDLFVSVGCAACHNGINVGGNSYQKFGTVMNFKSDTKQWPDRYAITKDLEDKSVFRVPSLRNIEKTAPYFHFGQTYTLKDAINIMAYHNLGVALKEAQVQSIEAFLKTLTGELPKTWKSNEQ